jgi:hypothetical protein
LPVSGHATANGGFESKTGLAYADLVGMSYIHHKVDSGRKLERPAWVTDNTKLSLVLARWMESRAQIRFANPGSAQERIKKAQSWIAANRPRQIAVLDKLCAALVEEKSAAAPDETRIKTLTGQIQNLDTLLRISEKGGGLAWGFSIIQKYYIEGFDSFEIAEQLGVSAVLVRQQLWRFRRTANRLNGKRPAPRRTPISIPVRKSPEAIGRERKC